MLVSAIITNHNYRTFLPEAIESALHQHGVDVEVVIVDDGSDDGSVEVIREYERTYPGVRGVFQPNLGQGAALNAGVRVACGEVLAFLDADDYWLPGKLAYVAGMHARYDLVQHNLLRNGRVKYALLCSGEGQRRKLLSRGFAAAMPTSGLSVTRALAGRIFPIPEAPLRLCADIYVKYRGLQCTEMWSCDEAFGVYRVHGSNGWYGRRDLSLVRAIVDLLNEQAVIDGLPRIPSSHDSFVNALIDSVPFEAGGRYVLYGAGGAGLSFQARAQEVGAECVGYVDSDPERWGLQHGGHIVQSPDALPSLTAGGTRIVVSSMHGAEILARLEESGYREGRQVLVPRL